MPHLRPGIAQLAFFHVSEAFRGTGIGRRLSDELDLIARDVGDAEIVVSATPSENTVRFYMSRGYELIAQALVAVDEGDAGGRAFEKGTLSLGLKLIELRHPDNFRILDRLTDLREIVKTSG